MFLVIWKFFYEIILVFHVRFIIEIIIFRGFMNDMHSISLSFIFSIPLRWAILNTQSWMLPPLPCRQQLSLQSEFFSFSKQRFALPASGALVLPLCVGPPSWSWGWQRRRWGCVLNNGKLCRHSSSLTFLHLPFHEMMVRRLIIINCLYPSLGRQSVMFVLSKWCTYASPSP